MALRIVVAVAVIVALMTPPERAPRGPVNPFTVASTTCWKAHDAESGFARRMSSARLDAGLGRLRFDPELSKAARVHTRRMIRRAELHHTPSHRLRQRVTNWTILGENVGVGSEVDSLHSAFMGSPLHRANIVNRAFSYVGVGALRRDGRLWVTVIFEGAGNPGTTLKMPSC